MNAAGSRAAWRTWPVQVSAAGVLAITGAGLLFMAWSGLSGLVGLPPVPAGAALLLAFLVATGVARLCRRPLDMPPARFLVIAVLACIAVHAAYALAVAPEWISDFRRYWAAASGMAAEGRWSATDVYEQRALPLLRPLAALGTSPWLPKIANLAALALVQAIGFDLVRRWRGDGPAQAFCLLWIAAPEPLLAGVVPSHDLLATAQLATAAWLVSRAAAPPGTGRARSIAIGAALGAVLVLLEIQRGIGLLAIASLVVTGLLALMVQRAPARVGGLVLATATAVALYFGGLQIANRSGVTMPPEAGTTAMLRYTTAHASSLSDGRHRWMTGFHDAFTRVYVARPERFDAFRRSLALSDFAQSPRGRAINALERLRGLHRLGGSNSFYTAGLSPPLATALGAWTLAGGLVFALLALSGLARAVAEAASIPEPAWFLLLLTAALAVVLAGVAENQPRYIFPLWLTGAILGSIALQREGVTRPMALRVGALAAGATLMGGAALLALALVVRHAYGPAQGRILGGWAIAAATANGEPLHGAPVGRVSNVTASSKKVGAPRDFGELAIILQLPRAPEAGDTVTATRTVCAAPARHALAFFVHTPYRNLRQKGAFRLELRIDGAAAWSADLPRAARPFEVVLPGVLREGACVRADFVLRSRGRHAADSWRRASRTEIFFPRLERDRLVAPPP